MTGHAAAPRNERSWCPWGIIPQKTIRQLNMSAILKVLSPWETPSLQKVYKTCFLHLFQNTAFKIVLNSSWLNVEVAYTLFCKLFNLFWFVISHYVYCLNSFLTFLSLLSTFLSPQKDWVSQHKKLHLKKKNKKPYLSWMSVLSATGIEEGAITL